MLRGRDWRVRGAPSCPPHSAGEPSDSRLKQWALAEVPRRGSCVVGIPLVLWCLVWSLLDLAMYMPGRRGTIHPVSTPRCPRGMAAHHYFPRLAMWAAQDVAPSRIAFRLELLVPVFPRSGVSPCRWLYDSWGGDQPAVVGGRVLFVCLRWTCLCSTGLQCPRGCI